MNNGYQWLLWQDKFKPPAPLNSAEEKLTRQQSPYLKLSLADRSGEIGANLWDVTPQQILEFSAGKVVEATGKISSYKDRLQVDIQTL